MRVTLAASTAGGHHDALASGLEITEEFAGRRRADNRADWDANYAVIAAPAMAVAAHTMLATPSFVLLLIAQIEQRRKLCVGFHDHVTATPAVPAARPAPRHELFPPKGDAATPAVAGNDANFGFVNKFHIPKGFRSQELKFRSVCRSQMSMARF
jgi:hypothetical protein